MAWSEKLKLSKQLVRSLTENGFESPTAIQQKSLARIYGGQDLLVISPQGSGKTTTLALAALSRLKINPEGVPKILILAADKDDVLALIEKLELLNKNKTILVVGLYPAPGTEAQMNALADGADIVVATPDRARALYLKLGLNLNKIELLIIDDADKIVKQGMQLPVAELANSITKCQHLVFTEITHQRLEKMISPFMAQAATIEVDEEPELKLETCPQVLYHVPNFGTKLNLLDIFIQDEEVFNKTVIFVNTRTTAEKIYKNLKRWLKNSVALLNSPTIEMNSLESLEAFTEADELKALVVINADSVAGNLQNIPVIIHFEIPANHDLFVERVTGNLLQNEEMLAITFVTDLELGELRKIESTLGQRLQMAELPENLIIEKTEKEKPVKTTKEVEPEYGSAFHQKKESNAKNYNYSAGQKAKMSKKKKHG